MHKMLKEILEQYDVSKKIIGKYLNVDKKSVVFKLSRYAKKLKETDKILIIACGSSRYAGMIIKDEIEETLKIPVEVEYANELRFGSKSFAKGSLVIAISQSGETKDTIEAIRQVKKDASFIVSITNNSNSVIANLANINIDCEVGKESALASTKSFLASVLLLQLFVLYLWQLKTKLVLDEEILKGFGELPMKILSVLDIKESINALAKKYKSKKHIIILGRGYNYPIALESAHKLKEVSYVHSEGYASGDFLHGPIAILDKKYLVINLLTNDLSYQADLKVLKQVSGKGAKIISLLDLGDRKAGKFSDDVIELPSDYGILSIVVLQLFSYYFALANDRVIDKPRYLVKSIKKD